MYFAEIMLTFFTFCPSFHLPCKVEQSQGEAEELHQCLRARDCCVCFPFLVHFSNSLDIQLDPTWTEVVVFC